MTWISPVGLSLHISKTDLIRTVGPTLEKVEGAGGPSWRTGKGGTAVAPSGVAPWRTAGRFPLFSAVLVRQSQIASPRWHRVWLWDLLWPVGVTCQL